MRAQSRCRKRAKHCQYCLQLSDCRHHCKVTAHCLHRHAIVTTMSTKSVHTGKYVENLSPVDRDCYVNKITLETGVKLPDPYSLKEWQFDMKKWPALQWPDIYNYLINSPSVYTKESLKAYKSLDAVNYILSGHVQKVMFHNIPEAPDYCVIRAEVLPSQRQGQKTKMYDAWVYVNRQEGYILTANCTCMAG